jgi:integrase
MASIRKRVRKDGSMTWQVLFRNVDTGKQEGITYTLEADANRMRKLLEANGHSYRIAEAAIVAADRQSRTVAQVVEEHIDHLIKPGPQTIHNYRAMLDRHIKDSIGAAAIESLDYRHITAWIRGMQKKDLSPKTIRNVHGLLSAAMETAVKLKYRPDNPCRGIDLPSTERRLDSMSFLTFKEFGQLSDAMSERYRTFLLFLVVTGARFGEATAVKVGDVNLDVGTPTVQLVKAWKRQGSTGYKIGQPKNAFSSRTVSLSNRLVEELRPLVEGRPADAFLFTNRTGVSHVDHRSFYQKHWVPTLKRLHADKSLQFSKSPRIHDLRHTSASWLIQEGYDTFKVARRLGHSSTAMIDKVYGHLMPDAQSEGAQKIGDAMGGKLLPPRSLES